VALLLAVLPLVSTTAFAGGTSRPWPAVSPPRPAMSPPRPAMSSPRLAVSPPRPGAAERLRTLIAERPRVVPLAPGARSAPRPQDDYDLRHVRLEIDLTGHESKVLSGAVSLRITSRVPALEEVVLDMYSFWLQADSVFVDGEPVPHLTQGDELRVRLSQFLGLGQSATVRVVYQGVIDAAHSGLTFGLDPMRRPYIWTLSQPSQARNWWPTKDQPDDKADSAEVLITVPDTLTATSNGLLRDVRPGPGATKTYWWSHSYPIATYLISVAAGYFTRLTGSYPIPGGGSLPTEFFVFPELVAKAEEDFSINNEAMDLFSSRFGPYPFLREKYGITVFGTSGGMEHQTNTSYFHLMITGTHYFDWIYVHELAHQWWGDDVTCETWADVWLNEGFASWCEALWVEHEDGPEAYRDYMVGVNLVWDRTGRIYGADEPFSEDAVLVYNKAAWVVHMLRGVLGDSLFYRGLAEHRARHTGGTATTAEFQEAIEAATGRDLDWFFAQWIYGPSWPTYETSVLAEPAAEGQRAWVHLAQRQDLGGPFAMPVRIRATAGTAVRDTVVWNDADHEDFALDLPEGPLTIEIDPDRWILRDSVLAAPYSLNIVTTDLDPVHAGAPVAVDLLARGGEEPHGWEALDVLPLGLTLVPETGEIRGTTDTVGEVHFRVQVRDSSTPSLVDTQQYRWQILPPAPDDTTGACCLAGSDCLVMTPDECAAQAGEFEGAIGSCDPNPCLVPLASACCLPSGACALLSPVICAAEGGAAQTAEADCDPNPCFQPAGACCGPDGSCRLAIRQECTASGGVFRGLGVACEPDPCPAGGLAFFGELSGVRAAPNPFRRSTVLVFLAPAGAQTSEWEVCDPSGRVVARGRGAALAQQPDLQSWVWDGRRLDGHRAPPGIYFVRGRIAGQAAASGTVVLF